MSKQKPLGRKPVPANSKKPPVYNPKAVASSLFVSFDNWLDKKSSGIAITVFSFSVLFSLLLFQARMDIGGDDSAYISRAYDFIHKGVFPSYQGPLYPIVLSLLMVFTGIKLIWLKSLSIIFNVAAIFFMYKAFKGRMPSFVFYSVLILTGINSYILNYASLTYSESFFMMIQALVFLYFFRLYDKLQKIEKFSFKDTYVDWLLAGLFIFLLMLTRNQGFACLLAFMAVFIMRKQYLYALYLLGAVLAFEIPAVLLEKTLWHVSNQWNDQSKVLLLKDPYDPAAGNETLNGFFVRFFGNCRIYFSKRFFQIIGLRSDDSIEDSAGLTFVFILTILFAFYRIIKSKNPFMLSAFLYTGIMIGLSFFALQTRWDQPRIIMVFVPFILFIIFFGLYDALKKAPWAGQFFMLIVIIILFFAGIASTINKAKSNGATLSKNMHGDLFYGYTPDWANYIRMSKWCADNLPANSMVATRKAEISFMYADKEMFFPVYKVYSTNADSVLDYFKKHNVNYVMLASLRGNPKVADGNIITTLWRMMEPVDKKYPQKVKLVHQEGTVESAFLYEIVQ